MLSVHTATIDSEKFNGSSRVITQRIAICPGWRWSL